MTKENKDLLVFGYGLAVIASIFCIGGTLKHGFGFVQIVLAVCALVFVSVTAMHWPSLRPGYKGWMKVAHFIGGIVATVLFSTVFFLMFAPVGILFRLIGKDHLDRRFDRAAQSYWHHRQGRIIKETYLQQG